MDIDSLIQMADWLGRAAWPGFLVGLPGVMGLAFSSSMGLRNGAGASSRSAAARRCVAVAAAAVFAGLALHVDPGGRLQRLDEAFLRGIASSTPSAVRTAFGALTHLGDPAWMWLLGIGLAAWLLHRRQPALAATWSLALLGNAAIERLFKHGVGRARPLIDGVPGPAHGFSFPSGHAESALVVYGLAAWLVTRLLAPRWQAPAITAAAGLVFTVAASRLFLQVHYPSDILGSLALGTVWICLCLEIADALRQRSAR